MKLIPLFFDFSSPYAYLFFVQLERFAPGGNKDSVRFIPHPLAMGPLITHHGGLGPAQIPAKRDFLFKQALRYAAREQIPFGVPGKLPFNPVLLLRLGLSEVTGERQWQVVQALFHGLWAESLLLEEPEVLREYLLKSFAQAEVDEWLERASSSEARRALKKNQQEALERGAFGVPSAFVDEELFWGVEALEALKEKLEGRDRMNAELFARFREQMDS